MALSKLAQRRLNTLIKFMRSLPASANKHFDMGSWFHHSGGDHEHIPEGGEVSKKHLLHSCGTSACALGWGCMVPSFRRAGLKLIHDGVIGEVTFGEHESGYAAEKFFDIDAEQVDDLFAGVHKDNTPKQWAKRAERLVREWSASRD